MSTDSSSPAPADFEAALKELEGLVASMETGDLSLEQSLAAHKRGLELARFCQDTLARAEQQVRVLEDGNLQPFSGDPPVNG
ncbi:MAG TPA: exodeoxyribonuclease VII small subunit [Burkholderiales bacterium]|nr:exodeoxyribonuclease VII small subunit [Burkholderiales bacterium]